MPKKKNLYLNLKAFKSKNCEGKASVNDVKAAAKEYINDAVAKGNHTKASATKIANDITQGACPVGTVGARKPRRKTTRRKTTTKK